MQRKNIPFRITYVLLILFFLAGAIFYRQAFLAILLLLVIILPIISIALTRYAFWRLAFDLSAVASCISLPDKPVILLKSSNPSLFPFLNCELLFHYQNMYFPMEDDNLIAIPIEAHKSQTFRFPFTVTQPGLFVFSVKRLYLTDYLHLYTFHKDLKLSLQLPVLPKELPTTFEPGTTRAETEDSELYDPAGAPSSDIREVREYLPGDRMQDIHWKLSARMEDLCVKQFEHSVDDSLLMLPELYQKELSDTMHTMYAIAIKLLRRKELFRLALFHTDTFDFTITAIHDTEELMQAILTLYFQQSYGIPGLARASFQTVYPLYSTFYHIHGTTVELIEDI